MADTPRGRPATQASHRAGLTKARGALVRWWMLAMRGTIATQVCYAKSMPSVTSSFRMSKELQRVLSDAAERTGIGNNAIIIEAPVKYLNAMERESLAEEARGQSELVDRKSTRLNSSHANISYAV